MKSRRTLTSILVIVVIILLIAIGVYYNHNGSLLPKHVIKDSGSGISDYSAVFLTNGQVYFGKIDQDDSQEIDLTDIYYLQVNQQIQPTQSSTPTPSAQPNVVLVKLGQELHGPNDEMHINKAQVLFTESLKTDSKVISAIQNFQSK